MKKYERKKIAAKWRERRQALNHTLESFCDKNRFDPAQLSRWETGEQIPSITSVERVEKSLLAEKS